MPEPQLFHCRAGFEADCAQELSAHAFEAGAAGECEHEPGAAFVLWRPDASGGARRAFSPRLYSLVFARQKIDRLRFVDRLREADCIDRIVQAARGPAARYSALWIEAPDSEAGRRRLSAWRALAARLEPALNAAGLLDPRARGPRLSIVLVEGDGAWVGRCDPRDGAPWPMGIPRLRSPAGAPSRASRKLVEALATFVGEEALASRMRAGRRAVDLGAAPGGFSLVLASRGMQVIAVDNGPIAHDVLATQLVEHRRADAFRFRPERPVDWMVCDVVAAPARIAALAAQWIAREWCRETIFNLKLPGKARWPEVVRCRAVIERALAHAAGDHALRIKHLYHDREEVTAHLRRLQ